jgi:hypothetical protein
MQTYFDEITDSLFRLRRSDLINLIATYADSNRGFREFIKLRLGLPGESNGASVEDFKKAIDEVLGADDLGPFLAPGKEERIDQLTDSIKELLNKGRATDVIEIVEYSFKYVENIAESIMEPDDFLSQCFDPLIDIHILACQRSNIDPQILAERLIKLENNDPYNVFLNLRERYGDLLDNA